MGEVAHEVAALRLPPPATRLFDRRLRKIRTLRFHLKQHRTDTKNVTGLERRFLFDFLVVDESPVAAAQILDVNLVSVDSQCAVLATDLVRIETYGTALIATDDHSPRRKVQSGTTVLSSQNDKTCQLGTPQRFVVNHETERREARRNRDKSVSGLCESG